MVQRNATEQTGTSLIQSEEIAVYGGEKYSVIKSTIVVCCSFSHFECGKVLFSPLYTFSWMSSPVVAGMWDHSDLVTLSLKKRIWITLCVCMLLHPTAVLSWRRSTNPPVPPQASDVCTVNTINMWRAVDRQSENSQYQIKDKNIHMLLYEAQVLVFCWTELSDRPESILADLLFPGLSWIVESKTSAQGCNWIFWRVNGPLSSLNLDQLCTTMAPIVHADAWCLHLDPLSHGA